MAKSGRRTQGGRQRYKRIDKEFLIRLMSTRRNLFSNTKTVEECIFKIGEDLDLNVLGYLDKRDRLIPLPSGGLAEIFPKEKAAINEFILSKDPGLEISLYWDPPEDDVFFRRARTVIEPLYKIAAGWGWDFAQRLFLTTVKHISPYWGELMVEKATHYMVPRKVPGSDPPRYVQVPEFPTMCGLDGHFYTVPHLGSANYFGPEYCAYFGGIQKFQQAGFSRVETFHEGVFTILTTTEESDEYLSKRSEVEAHLEPAPGTFDPNIKSPIPEFRRD